MLTGTLSDALLKKVVPRTAFPPGCQDRGGVSKSRSGCTVVLVADRGWLGSRAPAQARADPVRGQSVDGGKQGQIPADGD